MQEGQEIPCECMSLIKKSDIFLSSKIRPMKSRIIRKLERMRNTINVRDRTHSRYTWQFPLRHSHSGFFSVLSIILLKRRVYSSRNMSYRINYLT